MKCTTFDQANWFIQLLSRRECTVTPCAISDKVADDMHDNVYKAVVIARCPHCKRLTRFGTTVELDCLEKLNLDFSTRDMDQYHI